jgi:hypothetical protein
MCAFHGSVANYYKFGWVGVAPAGCPCIPQGASPNGANPSVDAAVNMMANVMAKTVTDPVSSAWYYYSPGVFVENAEQCSWYFANFLQRPNGAYYNMYGGGYNYLIQTNWNLNSQRCTMF